MASHRPAGTSWHRPPAAFIAGFFLILVFAPAQATTYYVDTNGDNNNPGTLALPWETIQKAADTMIAGDTVLIRGGVYIERVDPQNSGAPGNEITYRSYPGEQAVIDPGDTTLTGFAVVLHDTLPLSYLRFEDLTIRNAGGVGFYASSNPGVKSHLTLENVTIDNCYNGGRFLTVSHVDILNCDISGGQYNLFIYDGSTDFLIDGNNIHHTRIWPWGSVPADNIRINRFPGAPRNARITITNNEVHHGAIQGIAVWETDDVLIRGNHCHNNGATGIQIESDGSNPLPDLTKRVVVEDNICEYNSRTYKNETGIWIDDSDDVIVQNNLTRGNEIGIQLTGSYRVIVRHNVSWENEWLHTTPNRGAGILVRGSTQRAESGDYVVVHNTLYGNSDTSSRGQFTIGYDDLGIIQVVERVRAKNNVSSDAKGIVHLFVQGLTHTMDYNNYHEPSGLPNAFWQSGTVITWAAYLAASGQDVNSITSDPLLVNPAGGDFTLQPTSPCIDGGGFLTTTTSSGSGTAVPVDDAMYFSDGMGLIDGDAIQIGSETANVIDVDYVSNVITVDQVVSWTAGDGVGYPYMGGGPDMGAFETLVPTAAPTLPVMRSSMGQNYPNPFNPATHIPFQLERSGHVELAVYDVKGTYVRTLIHKTLPAGRHVAEWDGADDAGTLLASGVYFYELSLDGARVQTRKALLLK